VKISLLTNVTIHLYLDILKKIIGIKIGNKILHLKLVIHY